MRIRQRRRIGLFTIVGALLAPRTGIAFAAGDTLIIGSGDRLARAGIAGSGAEILMAAAPANVQFKMQGTNSFDITSNTAGSAIHTVTSASATAFQVGPNGSTNPTFLVVASTASAATGLSITSAAAAGGLAVAVISSGTNENLTIDAKGSGTITIGGVSTGAVTIGRAFGVTGALTVTSAGASALAVGANGATNPVLMVDASTTTVATGISIKGAAAAAGVAVAVISSGTNEALTLDAKGSGTISLGTTSTGLVIMGRGSAKVPVTGGVVTALAGTNQTLTAAQLLGGRVNGTPTGAATYTTDTAANLDAAIAGAANGDGFRTVVTNTSGGANTITLAGGTSVTLRGNLAVAQNKTAVIDFMRIGGVWEGYVTVSA